MTRYSVQPRDRIFVKGFFLFARNMGKNIDTNISKNLSGKYSLGMLAMRQKLFDHAKKSATVASKTSSKRVIQKTAEKTGDLIGNKTANKIARISKNSRQNNSKTVTNEYDKDIPKERYIYIYIYIYISRRKTRNY